MPRCSITRVLGLLPLTWLCLVGTWLFLPFPEVPSVHRDAYIEQTLRRGGALTTIHPYGDFYKGTVTGAHEASCEDGCGGLVLDWHLVADTTTDALVLRLGDARLNLTDAALRSAGADPHTPYYLSDRIRTRVRHGTTDDAINMPWFRWTDQVLVGDVLHGTMDKEIDVRVYSHTSGTVEIWKEVSLWRGFQGPAAIRDADRMVGLLASFDNVSLQNLKRSSTVDLVVGGIKGELPSTTWPIRHIICGPLFVPTFYLPLPVFYLAQEPTSLFILCVVAALVVLGLWVRAGTPEIGLWLAGLPVVRVCCRGRAKRARRRGVWGPSGPVQDEEEEAGLLGGGHKEGPSMFVPLPSKPSKSRARVLDKY
ncbi:uncharacterized protein PG998_013615 [Apiospora kogelbergensis]|uniref:uncharacterized protein n=1 Tax=Apiospora kogelbergensis TaxID=1337665 RepID=UPI003130C9D0